MNIELVVQRRLSSRIQRSRLCRVAARTLRAERANAALTIYITGDAEIRRLNRQFHATHAATDVLAFPASVPATLPSGRQTRGRGEYLGDVVISYERARAQARRAGWHIVDELELLAVHGILHLLGYDDRTLKARRRMWQRQKEILGRVAGDRDLHPEGL